MNSTAPGTRGPSVHSSLIMVESLKNSKISRCGHPSWNSIHDRVRPSILLVSNVPAEAPLAETIGRGMLAGWKQRQVSGHQIGSLSGRDGTNVKELTALVQAHGANPNAFLFVSVKIFVAVEASGSERNPLRMLRSKPPIPVRKQQTK